MTITDYDHKLWNYEENRQGLFRLTYGIYKPDRPLMSRDGKRYLFETSTEAIQFLRDRQKTHAEMGYRTWLAYLDNPDGSRTFL